MKSCVCKKASYCSKECQSQEYKNHQPHCVGFTLTKVRLKGFGLVASRDIEPGTVILAEKPLMVIEHTQVRSLSTFKVSRQLLTNDLNQVSSISLLMTSSSALANEGFFELTRRPLMTQAVSLSFAETIEEPGCSQVKMPKFYRILTNFGLFA